MVKGTKITELISVATMNSTMDELLAGSDGKTVLVPISAIESGIAKVLQLETELKSLSADIIHPVNSSTVNMYIDSAVRDLSADFTIVVDESVLFPQLPLIFTESLTATNGMHNRMIVLSSDDDVTVTLMPNLSSGLTVNFLRYGFGEVKFVSGAGAKVYTYPDSSYNLISHQNACVTAIKGTADKWNLKGSLGSLKGGKFIIEHNP